MPATRAAPCRWQSRSPRLLILILLLLLVVVAAVGVSSEPQSAAARVWSDAQPVAPPASVASAAPSLLSCLRLCLLRPPAGGCAALLHAASQRRCLLYARAACDAAGGGLRSATAPSQSRYGELSPAAPRPAGADCPPPADAADQCSRLCLTESPAADGESWTLLGHQLPASVDVWTTGDIWSSLWKQVTDQRCQIELSVTSSAGMVIEVATDPDDVNVKLRLDLQQQAVVILDRTVGASYPVLLSERLLQPPALTALGVRWCSGQVRVTAETATARQTVTVNLTLTDGLQFVKLSSYIGPSTVGFWRLGAHLVDPWLTSEQGWTSGREYRLPANTVLWRRVDVSALASVSVAFDCAGSSGCQVMFREQFHHSLTVLVIIDGTVTYVQLCDIARNTCYTYPIHSSIPVQPAEFRQFSVQFDSGTVRLFDFPDGAARLVLTQDLTDGMPFAPPPTRVSCVGLSARSQPTAFRVFRYDPSWGQEQGYSAGAGLLSEQEGFALMSPTAPTTQATNSIPGA